MNWFAVTLFGLVGIALIFWRHQVAEWQGLVAGGRLHPGCAVVQGLLLIVLALIVLVVRPY